MNLFRFRVDGQELDYTFICSIGLLRKETKYTAQKIYDHLKLLSKEKVIRVNISRWDRLLDSKGKLMDDKILIIEAIDKPNTYRGLDDKGKEVDIPCDPKKENYYISVNLLLMQYYQDNGLHERYYGLYCLMTKYSNKVEGKSWMSINRMADVLGFGDKTVNQMIYEMNRNYLLYSRYLKTDQKVIDDKGESKNGEKFEHYLLSNLEHREQWMAAYKESIDRNIKKWDKKQIVK